MQGTLPNEQDWDKAEEIRENLGIHRTEPFQKDREGEGSRGERFPGV